MAAEALADTRVVVVNGARIASVLGAGSAL
jgi:hypothetical protein